MDSLREVQRAVVREVRLALVRPGGQERGGIFRIDEWNDRIYVYQQDAPGTFNVPAFYGRGWNLSLYAAVHLGRHHSIWLRLDCVQYPWNLTPKQGKLECRLQYRWRS